MTDTYLSLAFLAIWNMAVLHYVSKGFYDWAKGKEDLPATYISRKVVHILAGGVTTLLIPVLFKGNYWLVVVAALLLASYVHLRRSWKPLYWFQVGQNSYEVHFALAYALVLSVGVLLNNIWVAIIPMLFMSFGDSATGLVRAWRQKKHVKSWDGTIAMFSVCSVIAYPILGLLGILLAFMASLVERIPNVDDNITVPTLSAAMVYLILTL